MKTIPLIIFLIGSFLATTESWGVDYTGFWKGDCTDNFGVQIKPVEKQLYSVSFCGSGGCFDPGEWMPNTKIEGDSKYKIISPTEIGIRHQDDSDLFIYRKCTNDPAWTVAKPATTEIIEPPDCTIKSGSNEQGVLIAWITDVREFTEFGQGIKTQKIRVEPFRPVALLLDNSLKETTGVSIHKGQSFWSVLSQEESSLKLHSVGSFFDHIVGRCVYFGSVEKNSPPHWTLLSSKPLLGVFRAPTKKDNERFYKLNTTCVQQGDYPEEHNPPCVRPKLLAVTELNKNDKFEYWATEPYLWDTGLTVWEDDNGSLTPLLQVCVGCSD